MSEESERVKTVEESARVCHRRRVTIVVKCVCLGAHAIFYGV